MERTRTSLLSWAPAAVILLAGTAVYLPSIGGGWVWDDAAEIARNPVLRDPAGLGKIWSGATGADYFPLKSTVQWVAWRLWTDHTVGYHVLTLALHLISALLLWRLTRRILGAGRAEPLPEPQAWGAWLGALLFALHPLAVESVAWIAELKNTLSLVLLLLAADGWVRWNEAARPAAASYLRSLAWFLAALLAKTSVVAAPMGFLLYGWWRRGRFRRREVLGAAPFFALSLVLGLVTLWFQIRRAAVGADLGLGGPASRIAVAGIDLVFYLGKFLFPHALAPIYPRWAIGPAPVQFLPGAVIAALALWLCRRRPRGAAFVLGTFAALLLPVLGFFPMAYVRISWVADHLAYAPLAVLCAGLGGLLSVPRRKVILAGLIVVLSLCGETLRQAGVFGGDETFWTETLRRNPRAWLAANDLGLIRAGQGKFEDAIAEYRQALRLKPDYPEAHNNLGIALAAQGRRAEARAEFAEALRLEPNYAEARADLGNVLAQSGRIEEAIGQYEAALRLRPADAQVRGYLAEMHYRLGNDLGNSGRTAEAMAEYAAALRLEPNHAEARANLGLALATAGRWDEAMAQLRQVLEIKPGYADAHAYLGLALAGAGRYPEAIAEYRIALRLGPGDSELHYHLGLALRAAGRSDEARAEFEKADRP